MSKQPEGPCWIWQGSRQGGGAKYGSVEKDGRSRLAHRVSYEAFYGSIPEGYQVDYLCNAPLCVNPFHLQVVTPRENTLRSTAVTAVNARKTHCLRGHKYTPENIYWTELGRSCRTCREAVVKERMQGPLLGLYQAGGTARLGRQTRLDDAPPTMNWQTVRGLENHGYARTNKKARLVALTDDGLKMAHALADKKEGTG